MTHQDWRRVLTIERALLWRPNANIVMTAAVSGRVERSCFLEAVKKAAVRHPMLRVRVEFLKNGIARLTDKDVPENPVAFVEQSQDISWQDRTTNEFRTPFDVATGPLCRFTVILSDDSSCVMVTAHHVIADGISMAFLLRDLLIFMANPDDDPGTLTPPPIAGNLHGSTRINPLARLVIRQLNKRWKDGRCFTAQDARFLHEAFWKKYRNVRLYEGSLGIPASLLLNRCRHENVSVNSAFCCALLAAQKAELDGSGKGYLDFAYIPVSVRKWLKQPAKECFGFYASAVRIRFKASLSAPFWEQSRKLHRIITRKAMRAALRTQSIALIHPGLLDAVYFEKYGLSDSSIAKKTGSLLGTTGISAGLDLSNLGLLDFSKQYGSLRLEGILGPCIFVDYHEKYIGCATFGDVMRYVVTYDADRVSPSRVELVMQHALRILEKAVSKAR